VVLLGWWLWRAAGSDPAQGFDPFAQENAGTVLAQWAVALVALLAANRWLARRSLASGSQASGSAAAGEGEG